MLVISHSENTFNKTKMRDDPTNPYVKKTGMKVRDFVKESDLKKFYTELK